MTTTSTSRRSSSSTVRFTGRAEGDLGVAADGDVESRRRAVLDAPWAWCHQVHGAAVHVVDRPGGIRGADGDALVTATPGVVLAVFTADCAPVALTSAQGVVGIAHAGWRGLAAGVLEATVAAMRGLGAVDIEAVLGPCIRPCCYAFGEHDLAPLLVRYGGSVRGTTTRGETALDLPAGVRAVLHDVGVAPVDEHGGCTACGDEWFSFRARQDARRQATLVVTPG